MHESLGGRRKRGMPSKVKAREMLRHGEVHGEPLSKAQRGYFGVIASGATPRKAHEAISKKGSKRRARRSRY